jgi:hypothetical protein
MKRFLWVIIFAFAASMTASAQLYQPGEVLSYRVSYKAKLFPNTEVATVDVRTTLDTLDGRPHYKVHGRGVTMPAFRWFFTVDDSYYIWADTLDSRTTRFASDIREGSYTFRSEYRYDRANGVVNTRWQKKQLPEQSKMMQISEQGMDPVSLYFNLRSVDLNSFREGEYRKLDMVLEDTIRHLRYRYIGRENLKVPRMGRFDTMKFACTIGSSEEFSFTDGTEFFIWITNDENKIPVMLASPVRVGEIRAYLRRYEGLKYPLSSKIK